MRIAQILAIVWTILCVWSCSEALYTMKGPPMDVPGAKAGVFLGILTVFATWAIGLGAIALVRHLFRPDADRDDAVRNQVDEAR